MSASGDSDISALVDSLLCTLKPEKDSRLEGERYLRQIERSPTFALRLIQIIDTAGQNLQSVRLVAAVTLKNYVKKYWPSPDSTEDFEVPAPDRDALKRALVPLMFRCPQFVQKLVSETINLIAWVDFPARWPELLPDLMSKFESGDVDAILGSLRTAHGLFKHYRNAFESNALWQEIKLVVDQFAVPFTRLFLATWNRIPELERLSKEGPEKEKSKEALDNAFQILLLCAKIYFSLISQELPQVFVDHLGGWMEKFQNLLNYDNIDLHSDNDEEPGILSSLKAQICAIVTLLAKKYDEDFEPYMAVFVEVVWKQLLGITQLQQDDLLAFNAMEFVANSLLNYKCRSLFDRENVLESICEKIIVPNIQFRQSDKELFEENPDEFIRRDIEGSDIHTRRRAAADLVRASTKHFEERVTKVLTGYIQFLIAEFQKDPVRNWKSKDSAIFLTSSLAAKGQTSRHGTLTVNPMMDVVAFAKAHVIPHLGSQVEQNVLKADCLKYIVTFRVQLPRAVLLESFPAIIALLDSPNTVVHTYAAHCIERIFTTKDISTGQFTLQPADIQPILEALLANLLKPRRLSGPDRENPDGVLEENEYTIKCIMRTLSYLQAHMLPYINVVVTGLLSRLAFAVKNPGNPRYDHYLFESLALCIGIACRAEPKAVELFETVIFQQIEVVLKENVDAFFPYAFQLMAQMLEYRVGEIPVFYLQLLDHLLNPALLEHEGCVPSVVRLLGTFFDVNPGQMTDRLIMVLGMFKRLILTKKFDHEGFNLLRPVIDKVPLERLREYLPEIFRLFFQRLSTSKTPKFVKNLVPFLFFFIVRHGPQVLIGVVDQVQTGIFGMLMEKVVLEEMGKLTRMSTRRLCFVGGTLLLTESPDLFGGRYDNWWAPLLEKLVKLNELPPEKEVAEDLHSFDLTADENNVSMPGLVATSQNQLIFAKKPERDVTADRGEPRQFLAQQLAKLSANQPGQVAQKCANLNPDVRNCVMLYCQAAGFDHLIFPAFPQSPPRLTLLYRSTGKMEEREAGSAPSTSASALSDSMETGETIQTPVSTSGSWSWGSFLQKAATDLVGKSAKTPPSLNDATQTIKEKVTREEANKAASMVKSGITSFFGSINASLAMFDEQGEATASASQQYQTRSQAKIAALQADLNTFKKEPPGRPEEFEAWLITFDVAKHRTEMDGVLDSSDAVQEAYNKLVPSVVTHNEFWQRYFYRVHQLGKEDRRIQMMMARSAGDHSPDDMDWGDDLDDSTPLSQSLLMDPSEVGSVVSNESFQMVTNEPVTDRVVGDTVIVGDSPGSASASPSKHRKNESSSSLGEWDHEAFEEAPPPRD
ncbi:Exportin-2 [Hypsibius exemplaris]|uniref:Exportin-2 n=1 Tax=Hypsibius exemplaris TaxID=2072580 RepID=A0A1W0WIY7_HYPEX|nr:Exportin-2 [Hypsibius exemplaris]